MRVNERPSATDARAPHRVDHARGARRERRRCATRRDARDARETKRDATRARLERAMDDARNAKTMASRDERSTDRLTTTTTTTTIGIARVSRERKTRSGRVKDRLAMRATPASAQAAATAVKVRRRRRDAATRDERTTRADDETRRLTKARRDGRGWGRRAARR